MKRRCVLWVLVFLLLVSVLTGCGGAASKTEAVAVNGMAMDMAAPQEAPMAMAAEEAYYGGAMSTTAAGTAPADSGAKIIYTADLDMETTAFDETVEALARLTADCGGYYESSSVNSGGGGYRYASYTVRIPAGQYRVFLNQAGQLCHLLYSHEYADDISEVYYDTAGRLKTQQTKLDRLQELLAQAKNMEDIIAIESAISETEEQIDYLSGNLRRYDALVDYSTVTVYLQEVYRLSNVEEPAQGFGSRFVSALSSGWRGFVNGMESILIALAYGWMWLLLLAAIAAVVVLLARRSQRRAKAARDSAKPTVYTSPEAKQEKKE